MALAAVAALTGAFVQSTTGFGFALVLSPALFAVMDPVEAVMALLVLGFALSLLVLFERGRPRHVDWHSLVPMLAAALPGLGVGAIAVTQASQGALQGAGGGGRGGGGVVPAAPPAAGRGASSRPRVRRRLRERGADHLDKRERP